MTHREEFRTYMKAANGHSDDRHLTEAQVIAYCRNEMPVAEHEAAETHLVGCEQCITLFRNARDFLEPAGDDEKDVTAAETDEAWRSLWREVQGDAAPNVSAEKTATILPGDFQRAREKQFLSRTTLALAAGLAISLLVLGWQTWRLLSERRSRQQSQEIAMLLEGKQRELEQRLSQVEQNGRDQLRQEREQRLTAEAERDHLQDQLSRQSSEPVPLYTARLSSERGAEDTVRVRFGAATRAVRLKLLISKPYEFPEYAIELSDESGRVVMNTSGLRPSGDDGALSLRINRSPFHSGRYKLRLFGGKEKKPLGEYGISMTVGR